MDITGYTIHCTADQTRRAIALGAYIVPNFVLTSFKEPTDDEIYDYNLHNYVVIEETNLSGNKIWQPTKCPTAEQMCGWLREKFNLICTVGVGMNEKEYGKMGFAYVFYEFDNVGVISETYRHGSCVCNYEEAILYAIDAALDYLATNKGEKKGKKK